MKIDWSQNPEHLRFVEDRLQITFQGVATRWLTTLSDAGEILGVVVYSHFTEHNCEITVVAASPKFISKKALAAMFGYPFNQLGLRRVTAVVRESNSRSHRAVQRLGFTVEGVLRGWFGDEPGTVWGMLREECKWI